MTEASYEEQVTRTAVVAATAREVCGDELNEVLLNGSA